MENNKKKKFLTEFALGLAFIILLLAIVLIVLYWPTSAETVITNSCNTYNAYTVYNYVSQEKNLETKPYFVNYKDNAKIRYVSKPHNDYYVTYRYNPNKIKNWKFNDANQRKILTGIFDNYFYSYEVRVKNLEYVGGYFKVVYYFEDYYGDKKTESFVEYISARKEKTFVLKDVTKKYEFTKWSYDVFPLSN